MTAPHHPLLEPRETVGCNASRGKAVLLEDFRERERGSRRCERVHPVLAMERAGNRLDFGARHGVGGREGLCGKAAVGEETLRHADAPDLQRLETLGFEAAADDELGRSAADVDDEPRLARCGQHVRDAVVDEPRFLVAGDDVDREP